jgi:deazaflavin-dependent oxidoreductase (nitroreductase family)
VRDGGDYIVVGSWGGSDTPPHWYLNVRADPRVVVEDHGHVTSAVAIEVDDPEEYERLWRRLVAIYPAYEEYRRRTTRRLSILRLSPVGTLKTIREQRI